MDDFDLEWMERAIATDKARGKDYEDRERWTNGRMASMIKAIRDRDLAIKEVQAALSSLVPGYTQYLEWAAERGTMFLKDGREVLRRAYIAGNLPPPVEATKPTE